MEDKEVGLSEPEWLARRQKVITATESAVLLGLNPWSSPAKMYQEKTEKTFTGNAYTLIGQWLEPVVIQATNHVLGTDFRLLDSGEGRAFYTHPRARLGATPDASDSHQYLSLPDKFTEAKTTKPFNYIKYSHNPPKYYIMQLMTQLFCGQKESGYLSIMSTDLTQHSPVLNLPLSVFVVTSNPKLESLLEQEVARFWKCHAEGKQFRVSSKVKMQAQLLVNMSYEKVV